MRRPGSIARTRVPTFAEATIAPMQPPALRSHVWHPFTQMSGWESEGVPVIEAAEGSYLIDSQGRRYIDGVSSLWCNVHGHRHPRIDAAVRDQLERVAHTTTLGLSHPPAEQLARRLVELAPGAGEGGPRELSRVFYSDSGSTAVEVALKMAFQYWRQADDRRPRRTGFVCLDNAYHGDTIGSVSVGGIDLFHSLYRPLLFDSHRVPAGDVDALGRLLEERGDEIAAVVVEPLVQGAAGMRLQPPGYLRAVRELCDRHDLFLVCDEVATGFGRTGTMFACEQEHVVPDFLCVAKGLSGGYLPLAATLTTDRVHAGFLGEHAEFRTFFHGHTYTGNPLACAAALASLDVFAEERTLEQLGPKIALLEQLTADLVEPLDHVAEVRRRGFMCGIELADYDPSLRMGHQVTLEARARGAVVRPLGDVLVLVPPLSIEPDLLEELVEIVSDSIAVATGQAIEALAA
jgi:adenosylmethionine---8-amino-7-oxononanoate aminotransferase